MHKSGNTAGRRRHSARKCRAFVIIAAAVCVASAAWGGARAQAQAADAPAVSRAPLWERAVQVVNPNHLDASINSISCTAPGDCTATGAYTEVLNDQDVFEGFVVEERNGIWGAMTPIPGLAALNVGGQAYDLMISCSSPGTCTVAGEYLTKYVSEIFVASERAGRWGRATPLPGIIRLDGGGNASLTALSCDAPGDCTAVGSYLHETKGQSNYQPFLAFSAGGEWFLGPPPGFAKLDAGNGASLDFVSCTSRGNCVAAGNYVDSYGEQDQGVLIEEHDGFWGTTALLPGAAATSQVTALYCAAPGSCVAAGTYRADAKAALQVALWQEKGGTWSGPRLITGLSGIVALSCSSVSACVAIGYRNGPGVYIPTTSWGAPALLVERAGAWGAPRAIPGLAALSGSAASSAALTDVSCGAAGECALAGFYETGSARPSAQFVANEAGGAWSKARPAPGLASSLNEDAVFSALSCTSGGYCGAGGADSVSYRAYPGLFFSGATVTSLAAVASTATSLTLSAGKVGYGHEQTARLAVTVTARGGGRPAGAVIITAGKTIACVLTVRSGRGACALSPARLRPGRYRLIARYQGSALDAGSASAPRTLTVVK
jgi:hypothetical protein